MIFVNYQVLKNELLAIWILVLQLLIHKKKESEMVTHHEMHLKFGGSSQMKFLKSIAIIMFHQPEIIHKPDISPYLGHSVTFD